MNYDELQEIRDRVAKATPGPWTHGTNSQGQHNVFGPEHEDVTPAFCRSDLGQSMAPEDAEFIAHARLDVVRLIAEIERLQGPRA